MTDTYPEVPWTAIQAAARKWDGVPGDTDLQIEVYPEDGVNAPGFALSHPSTNRAGRSRSVTEQMLVRFVVALVSEIHAADTEWIVSKMADGPQRGVIEWEGVLVTNYPPEAVAE